MPDDKHTQAVEAGIPDDVRAAAQIVIKELNKKYCVWRMKTSKACHDQIKDLIADTMDNGHKQAIEYIKGMLLG